jgi:energy-coupling factor transport system ATP-binding protein
MALWLVLQQAEALGYVIEFRNVSWRYQGSSEKALQNINLKVKKGEVLVITGPSGAGKTTLCRCINGLIPHFFEGELEGDVFVSGMDVRAYDIPYLAAKVGLLFDDPSNQLFNSTVEEELAFGPENYGVPVDEIMRRIEEGLRFARLENQRLKNPHALSGGQQQACALAAIYTMRPDVFVLDEPTANLDPYGAQLVFQRLRELIETERKTFMIVEHNLENVLPFADRLVVMDKGKIVASGIPSDVLKEVDLMEGIDLQVPHATELAYALHKLGYQEKEIPFTTEDGTKLLHRVLPILPLSKTYKPVDPLKRSSKVAVELENVSYTYPDGTVALKNVSLKIMEGDYVGFIGRNGSGKTTLAKMLIGLIRPTSGTVRIYGEDTERKSIAELARLVGYNFQNPDDQIFARTVREELSFAPKNLKLPEQEIERAVLDVAKELELAEYLDVNPFSLSQGLRRRVAFGSTLTLNPKILVVDEPTTGQDYARAKVVMELCKKLNNQGKTIIIISHNMDLIAEYCNYVYVMKDGTLLMDGTPKHVFSKPEVLIETSIVPPQITRIFQGLQESGFPKDIITMDEALEFLGIKRV